MYACMCFQVANEWSYSLACVKSLSINKRDNRGIFLYVIDEYSDDFQIYFSSKELCEQ